MKFNKLYMALGVAAIALTACSDEDEYTPAPAVVTPAAYFNISDDGEVDLENTTKEFSLPIYRAEAGDAWNPTIAIEIVSGDGVSPAYAPFTALNSDSDPVFAAGATVGAIKYAVDMDQIVPMNEYNFYCKVDGESTPYFVVSKDYVVSYVPWVSMGDDATGALSTLIDDAMWQCLQGGLEMTLDVNVEKHPEKQLFRLQHPYLNAVGAINAATGANFAEYDLDPEDNNYLYLNAENPNAVFICNKNGELGDVKEYYPGVKCIYNDTWKGYGDMMLINGYWYFVNQEWYMVSDSQGLPDDTFAGAVGQYKDGNITFNTEDAIWFGFNVDKQAVWSGKSWTLKMPGAASIGWSSMGSATFTEGFVAQFYGEANPVYQDAVWENTTTPGLFRLTNPYRYGTYPLADSSSDASGDGPWNIIIDCTDPDYVIIEPQATGFMVGVEQIIGNAAGVYSGNGTVGPAPSQTYTKDQIIANGWNDTYDAATRTITINHPMLTSVGSSRWEQVWTVTGFQPSTIVLPSEAAEVATQGAKVRVTNNGGGKISFARANTNIANRLVRR